MKKAQNEVDDITKIVKENLRLLEKRQITCEDLLTSSENLRDKSQQFSRTSEETKWRHWWKKYIQKSQIIFLIVFGLIILLLLLIGFIKLIYIH